MSMFDHSINQSVIVKLSHRLLAPKKLPFKFNC